MLSTTRRLTAAAVFAGLAWLIILAILLGLFAADLPRAALAAGVFAGVIAMMALSQKRV